MRDLTARLREIVRRETATRDASATTIPDRGGPPIDLRGVRPSQLATSDTEVLDAGVSVPLRELTYVLDAPSARFDGDVARHLGGVALGSSGACVVIDRQYGADRSHGRARLETCVPAPEMPMHLFDPRVASVPDWWRRIVFFDIETTGLSGGAGTLAFLAGCGWFDDSGFVVRQFFLAGPSGERAMLQAIGDILAEASLLVTYNGRTFDMPFMETRWAFHRTAGPADDLPHFDMLPPARRLWSRREQSGLPGDVGGCGLSVLERAVLGFHRLADVPGFEIPARYFQFLRTGNAAVVEGVLEHNRHDLVSLAALMAHAFWLAREGPEACREPSERLALGQLYERAGDEAAAARAFEMAAATATGDVRQHALARLATLLRRQERYQEAATVWQEVVTAAAAASPHLLSPIERRAAEALAIHHEHRAKDLDVAKRYAEALDGTAFGRVKAETEHRLARLRRKMSAKSAARDAGLSISQRLIEDCE